MFWQQPVEGRVRKSVIIKSRQGSESIYRSRQVESTGSNLCSFEDLVADGSELCCFPNVLRPKFISIETGTIHYSHKPTRCCVTVGYIVRAITSRSKDKGDSGNRQDPVVRCGGRWYIRHVVKWSQCTSSKRSIHKYPRVSRRANDRQLMSRLNSEPRITGSFVSCFRATRLGDCSHDEDGE